MSLFVPLIRVAENSLSDKGGAAVGRSLTALTALQTLNLSGKPPCVAVLCVREGVVARGCFMRALLCR